MATQTNPNTGRPAWLVDSLGPAGATHVNPEDFTPPAGVLLRLPVPSGSDQERLLRERDFRRRVLGVIGLV